MRARVPVALTATAALTVLVATPALAAGTASDDSYTATSGQPLSVAAAQGVLANDSGTGLNVVRHSAPAHGTLAISQDGSFTYTPTAGYTGPDSFTYAISDAVHLSTTHQPPLATVTGVPLTGGAYGSSLYPVPGSTDEYYGVEDRGPNVSSTTTTTDPTTGRPLLIEPLPSYDPSIAKIKLVGANAVVEQVIPLTAADGTPYSGKVNSDNDSGETIRDINGNILPSDPNGYDPEGLVALPDGTFWVSDEYGPFITHFDATGKQISRLTPFNGTLPVELRNRLANRGLEGLTVTPDGSTLVATMQSSLQSPDNGTTDPKKVAVLRLVTYVIATGETHEYAYMLDNPGTNKTAVSELTAVDATHFIVDERDGNFPPSSYKKLWTINLAGATDIGPTSPLIGTTVGGHAIAYDATSANHLGLTIDGQSLEKAIGTTNTATATTTLSNAGITVMGKTLKLDLINLLVGLDPTGNYFGHDKVEGVAITPGQPSSLTLSNDSDFGISSFTGPAAGPYQLVAKTLNDGRQDDGEILVIDTDKLTNGQASTSTGTVTFNDVSSAPPASLPEAPVSALIVLSGLGVAAVVFRMRRRTA